MTAGLQLSPSFFQASSREITQQDREPPDRGVRLKGPVDVEDLNENGRATTQGRLRMTRRSTDDVNDLLSDEALEDHVAPTPDEMRYVLGDAEYANWIELWRRGKEFSSMRQWVLNGHIMTPEEAQQHELDKTAYNQAGAVEYQVKAELYRRGEARPAIVEWMERRILKARQRHAKTMKPKMDRYQQLKRRVMKGVAEEPEQQEFNRLANELKHVYGNKGPSKKKLRVKKENQMAELEGKGSRTVLEEGQLARLKEQAKRKKEARQRRYQREKAAAATKAKRIDTLQQMETRTRGQNKELKTLKAEQDKERLRNRKNVGNHRTKKKMEQGEKMTDAQKLNRIDTLGQLDIRTPAEEEEIVQLKAELKQSEHIRERNREKVRKHREKQKKMASEARQSQASGRSTTSDASKQTARPSTSDDEKKKDSPVQQFANHPRPGRTTTANIVRITGNYLSHAELGLATALRKTLREASVVLLTMLKYSISSSLGADRCEFLRSSTGELVYVLERKFRASTLRLVFSLGHANGQASGVMAPLYSFVATACLVAAISGRSLVPRALGDLCSLFGQRVAIVGNRLFFMGGQYIYDGGQPSSQQSLSWIYLNESFPVEASISSGIIHSVRVPDHVPIIEGDFWLDNTTLFLPAGSANNETPTPGSLWSFDTLTDQWKALPVQGGDFNFGLRDRALVASVPLYGLSFLAGGDNVPIGGMLMLDSSNAGAPMWKTITDGDGSSGAPIPMSYEGEMVYVRAGNRGLLVTFGGYDTSRNGTEFPYRWPWDRKSMDQITVYDIESSTWFTVTATGDIPSKRVHTCTTVSSSPDDSSFQITMYGGWDLMNNVAFEDVYVLAIPAFMWIKISGMNNADSRTGMVGRHGQKCKLWGNRDMLVLGGGVTAQKPSGDGSDLNTVACNPSFPPIRILDTTTFTWKTNFDPRPSYTVPSAIYQMIGGDGSGKANLSRHERGSNASRLDEVLSKRVPLIPDALPAAPPSPQSTPVTMPPAGNHDQRSATGAIVGGTVGGLCALGVVIGLLVVRRRRRRARDRTHTEGWTKPELSNESASLSRFGLLPPVPGPGPGVGSRVELAGSDDHQPVVLQPRSIGDVNAVDPPLPLTNVHELGLGVAEMAEADEGSGLQELDSNQVLASADPISTARDPTTDQAAGPSAPRVIRAPKGKVRAGRSSGLPLPPPPPPPPPANPVAAMSRPASASTTAPPMTPMPAAQLAFELAQKAREAGGEVSASKWKKLRAARKRSSASWRRQPVPRPGPWLRGRGPGFAPVRCSTSARVFAGRAHAADDRLRFAASSGLVPAATMAAPIRPPPMYVYLDNQLGASDIDRDLFGDRALFDPRWSDEEEDEEPVPVSKEEIAEYEAAMMADEDWEAPLPHIVAATATAAVAPTAPTAERAADRGVRAAEDAERVERAAAAQAADPMEVNDEGPLVSYDAADPEVMEVDDATDSEALLLAADHATVSQQVEERRVMDLEERAAAESVAERVAAERAAEAADRVAAEARAAEVAAEAAAIDRAAALERVAAEQRDAEVAAERAANERAAEAKRAAERAPADERNARIEAASRAVAGERRTAAAARRLEMEEFGVAMDRAIERERTASANREAAIAVRAEASERAAADDRASSAPTIAAVERRVGDEGFRAAAMIAGVECIAGTKIAELEATLQRHQHDFLGSIAEEVESRMMTERRSYTRSHQLLRIGGAIGIDQDKFFHLRLQQRSGLTLFEERALRAEARDKANDAAVAREKLRELHPRLPAMEKAAEALADLKAAAMTSATKLAEAEAWFRRQDQELQRLRARLRLAEQRVDYRERVHDEGRNAVDSAQAVLAEMLRLAEVEIESLKGKRLEEARAFVEICRADQATIRELAKAEQDASGGLQDQIRLRHRVQELEKEPASKRDINRKVGDNLLLEEELRLLKEEMGKLRLANTNRAAEQQELAALDTRINGSMTRAETPPIQRELCWLRSSILQRWRLSFARGKRLEEARNFGEKCYAMIAGVERIAVAKIAELEATLQRHQSDFLGSIAEEVESRMVAERAALAAQTAELHALRQRPTTEALHEQVAELRAAAVRARAENNHLAAVISAQGGDYALLLKDLSQELSAEGAQLLAATKRVRQLERRVTESETERALRDAFEEKREPIQQQIEKVATQHSAELGLLALEALEWLNQAVDQVQLMRMRPPRRQAPKQTASHLPRALAPRPARLQMARRFHKELATAESAQAKVQAAARNARNDLGATRFDVTELCVERNQLVRETAVLRRKMRSDAEERDALRRRLARDEAAANEAGRIQHLVSHGDADAVRRPHAFFPRAGAAAAAVGGDFPVPVPVPAPAAPNAPNAPNAPGPEGPGPVVVVRPPPTRAPLSWPLHVLFLLAVTVAMAGATWLDAERERRLWASANAIPKLCQLCASGGREALFDRAGDVWAWAAGGPPDGGLSG
ncbi:MAG: hypothetical protein M1826_003904 [Phylliscum demangeonii]|nr:MAG: hypothetical protein M1826_003904 [Phylliscum demangeonii]